MRFFHRKNNRLCAEKEIGFLFSDGIVNFVHPIKAVIFLNKSSEPNYKLLVSVSKRNYKKAVDRNLLKRRMREAFRKNAFVVSRALEEKGVEINIALIYVSKKIGTYQEIEVQILKHISFITNRIGKVE